MRTEIQFCIRDNTAFRSPFFKQHIFSFEFIAILLLKSYYFYMQTILTELIINNDYIKVSVIEVSLVFVLLFFN